MRPVKAIDAHARPRPDPSRATLRLFGPILIITGILGFVIPQRKALTSGAPSYNVFHLIFGGLGVACAASPRRRPAQIFNIGFGALDLYQFVASRRGWFPKRWFRWKAADDVLHLAVGCGLILAGLCARPSPSSPSPFRPSSGSTL